MGRVKWRHNSIVTRLTVMVVIVIVLQTVLLTGTLIIGGVFEQAEQNAFRSFYDKVNNRKEFVQREMKNRWTNIDPYMSEIEKMINSKYSNSDQLFQNVMDQMIALLRTTQVTGAYVVLNQGNLNSNRYPALYLRDYDPLSNIYSDDDIYMLCGPANLAMAYQIPLDQTWQYQLKLTDENNQFFDRPFTKAEVTTKANLIGYWSKPFKLSENDVPIITYSMPLYDNSGNPLGVIGIEVTINYLTDFFPATELQPRDSLGYLIAYKENVDSDLMPIIMNGALQKRLIDDDEPLELSVTDSDQNIFELMNHQGNEVIYSCVEKLGLYQINTPFEDEQWYLIGFMREDYLLSYVERIKQILQLSLVFSVILGIIGGAFISYYVSKPILKLAKEVNETDKSKILHLNATGLLELDALSGAIETANKLMLDSASRLSRIIEMVAIPIGAFEMNKRSGSVFVTNQFYDIIGYDALNLSDEKKMTYASKESFVQLLETVFSFPENDEIDVYRINVVPERWVRVNTTEVDDLVIGVVMDATEEILEKRAIKRDRDLDPLTKLLNRKGFQWQFELLVKNITLEVAALMMFDLDNLKQINDSYGHKWGDQYILKAVERLESISDDQHKLLGRRSGDEFVLLLYGFESRDALRMCIKQFFSLLPKHQIDFPDGLKGNVKISAGLMWYENSKLSYDEMLHYADEALYESKRNSKGYFTESNY